MSFQLTLNEIIDGKYRDILVFQWHQQANQKVVTTWEKSDRCCSSTILLYSEIRMKLYNYLRQSPLGRNAFRGNCSKRKDGTVNQHSYEEKEPIANSERAHVIFDRFRSWLTPLRMSLGIHIQTHITHIEQERYKTNKKGSPKSYFVISKPISNKSLKGKREDWSQTRDRNRDSHCHCQMFATEPFDKDVILHHCKSSR